MERHFSQDEQRRLAAVRRELAVMMGREVPPLETQPITFGEVRISELMPGQEVVLFERNSVFDREIPRRETFNEGEQLSPTLRRANERRG